MAMPMAAFIMPPSSRASPPLSLSYNQASSTSDDPAKRFGLAGLTVLLIPNINDIATIYTQAEERHAQLEQGTSTQETLIYYNTTTSHLNTLCATDQHRDWSLGSSTYKGIGTQQKGGDSGIRPDPPRSAGNQFPTLVIEAGDSESLPQLHRDKDWWFDNSPPNQPEGDVKIVLLIKVYRPTKRIVVEQWYRYSQSPYATVVITPHPHKPFSLLDSSHWVVQGAPMVIPFQDVFLRPSEGQETDIVLTKDFFADMGRQCWETETRV
ncbi:hypothetical protein B0T25DRAFT_529018 [Lasiosphaeria hispida]|uniref:Uncharacterized protein n=1 Tax=Lasiosphaeria hispida TaxID=260671 RepID=A0AAJ0MKR3_9PEZI|nr:hypothetical protein B0T25DRAFT_529018 [Lasiosphaeria hispida]